MFWKGCKYCRDDLLTGLHNVGGGERICEYRDSRNNLKPFTGGGFPQSLIKTDKFKAWNLTACPHKRGSELKGIRCSKGMEKQDPGRLVSNKVAGPDFRPLTAQPQKHLPGLQFFLTCQKLLSTETSQRRIPLNQRPPPGNQITILANKVLNLFGLWLFQTEG
jgi:hypothetical protein